MAAEDLIESVAGVDYDRHLWMQGDACGGAVLVPTIPHLERARPGCRAAPESAAFSVAWEQDYRNLVRKKETDSADGQLHFTHRDLVSSLELRYRPVSWATLHSRLEHARKERNFSDNTVGQDFDETPWLSRSAVELFATPGFVPLLAVGAGSEGGRELALGARGSLAFGNTGVFAWSAAAGNVEKNHPLVLRLENYRPMSVPVLLRQEYQALSAGWRGPRWEFTGTGRWRQEGHPEKFDPFYSLADSGNSREAIVGAAYSSAADSGAPARFRISLEGEYLEGGQVFRGVRSSETLYQFSYEQTRHRNAWVRTDLQLQQRNWRAGGFAGASSLDWEALRPAIPSGKQFWDRSGVIDSYQGSILNIFTRETWLFDGDFRFRQGAAGLWAEASVRGWTLRPGLNFHVLDMEAHGRLTKKTSTLIIAYTEKDYRLDFHGLTARFLTPELGVSRRFGRGRVELFAAQAIPVDVRLRHGDGESSGESPNLSSARSYSGGTRANFRFAWEAF